MKRRRFLKQTTAISAGILSSALSAADPVANQIVDTHTHFYDPTRKQGVPWPEPGSPLYRPVFPADWKKVASPLGVSATIVIEASKWIEDNQWVLDLAAQEKSIVGYIGQLWPYQADFKASLKRFAAYPIFKGVRVNADDFALLSDETSYRAGVKHLADSGLVLESNTPPSQLLRVAKLAADIPSLRIVVDHLGSAGDPKNLNGEWLNGMSALAKHPNVFCKVSGLIEQTDLSGQKWGQAPRETAYYLPILDHLWKAFGEDRLIYGSNWPVCEKGGTYADQFKIVQEYFGAKGASASEKYFSGNSRAAFHWKSAGESS
jgi:predicted TIM-barrel fold metal-dependent hydrolase